MNTNIIKSNVPERSSKPNCLLTLSILSGFLAAIIYIGCETNLDLKSTLPLNDTIEIANFETRYNFENHIGIRMDSVLSDSRCPSNVQCVWEGNAEVRFLFTEDSIQTGFVLNTHGGSKFNTDTVINGYRIEMLNLFPYPKDPGEILQVEYYSEIFIENK
ncbi:hypothetical protein KA005_34850 [bacterium]|nr:hypothetical protein [bacterium]